MRNYQASYLTQLRLRPETWRWVVSKSQEAKLPVSTWIKRRLAELAEQELRKDTSDGGLSPSAGD